MHSVLFYNQHKDTTMNTYIITTTELLTARIEANTLKQAIGLAYEMGYTVLSIYAL